MVRPSREIIYPVMPYGHKREIFYCAFSCLGHGPYIRRSNLAISRRLQGGESETELVISSSAQGPAKNTTDKDRLDVLLTDDSRNRGNYNF